MVLAEMSGSDPALLPATIELKKVTLFDPRLKPPMPPPVPARFPLTVHWFKVTGAPPERLKMPPPAPPPALAALPVTVHWLRVKLPRLL